MAFLKHVPTRVKRDPFRFGGGDLAFVARTGLEGTLLVVLAVEVVLRRRTYMCLFAFGGSVHFASCLASSRHDGHAFARSGFDMSRWKSVNAVEVGCGRSLGCLVEIQATRSHALVEVIEQQRH